MLFTHSRAARKSKEKRGKTIEHDALAAMEYGISIFILVFALAFVFLFIPFDTIHDDDDASANLFATLCAARRVVSEILNFPLDGWLEKPPS